MSSGVNFTPLDLSACVLARDSETLLRECLARLRPFVKELIVGDMGSKDRSRLIAQEYGAQFVDLAGDDRLAARAAARRRCTAAWILDVAPRQLLTEEDLEQIGKAIDQATGEDRELHVAPSGSNGQRESRQWTLVRNVCIDRMDRDQKQRILSRVNGAHGRIESSSGRSFTPALSIALVTVGYHLPGATKALLESAVRDCRHHLSFLVFSHSRLAENVDESSRLARPNVVHRDYGVNHGLAKSWNEGILWGFDNGHDVVVVVNEDVLFSPGDLAKLAESASAQPDRFLVTARCFHEESRRWDSSEYGCFAVNRLALEVLGSFDENFFPVYCEDCDYRYRAQLAGLSPGHCGETALCHCGSASLRDPRIVRQDETSYAANRAYYARKWGGDPGQEIFRHPFNDPQFGFNIDPGMREAPYAGFNRTDQHLV